jgi:hypothetical protein
MAVLAAGILMVGVASAGAGDVLFWMVDGNSVVWHADSPEWTASPISEFFASYEGATSSDFAARIRVTGGDITTDTFLDLYDLSDGTTYSGEFGVDFSDNGGYWGAGVPTGNQSPSGIYSEGSPEYSFTVELGNIIGDGNGGWTWTTVAHSATETYSSLVSQGFIHETFDLNPSSAAAWTPASFAVPEPSSGLLTVIGFVFLALRRKRKGA